MEGKLGYVISARTKISEAVSGVKQGRYAFAARLAEQARLIPREKQDVPPEERPALYMDYK